MRTLIILFFLCCNIFSQAQTLDDIRFNKDYKTISISPQKKLKPIAVDTVRIIDTVYFAEKLPVQQQEKFAFEPLVNDVSSPLNDLRITSNYGMRFHPIKKRWLFHSGVDFDANSDTVRSVLKGTIFSSGYNDGLGYYVKVQHNEYIITYAHLSEYYHLKDMDVRAGEAIGLSGNTGLSTGEHLHFSVHYNGNPINPLEFLKNLIKLKTTLALNNYENRPRKTISN